MNVNFSMFGSRTSELNNKFEAKNHVQLFRGKSYESQPQFKIHLKQFYYSL